MCIRDSVYSILNGFVQDKTDFRRVSEIQVLCKLASDIALCEMCIRDRDTTNIKYQMIVNIDPGIIIA